MTDQTAEWTNPDWYDSHPDKAAAEIDRLEAQVATLRLALEPFAFIGRLEVGKPGHESTMVARGRCFDAEAALNTQGEGE